jgi:hypothetical protein
MSYVNKRLQEDYENIKNSTVGYNFRKIKFVPNLHGNCA